MQLMPHELWVHPLNDLREEKGEFYTLYPDLRHFPPRFFHTYHMGVSKFDELLELLAPRLRKADVNFTSMISPEQQLVNYTETRSSVENFLINCFCTVHVSMFMFTLNIKYLFS